MFDYARISTMLRYEKSGVYPWSPLKGGFLPQKVQDVARILINKGPIRKPYISRNNSLGASGIFRHGTRGWEYPWTIEMLTYAPKGALILDCGCGQSQLLNELSIRGFRMVGLDCFITDREFKQGKDGVTTSFRNKMKSKVQFLNGGMSEIPAEDNSFDVVTCISVMEHVVISTRKDKGYHFKCLEEMRRVLKPGGLLICTYDTILNKKAVYGGTLEWGEEGWYYADDIEYLQMQFVKPEQRVVSRQEILEDEDAFFIPPDIYFQLGFGQGLALSDTFHRLTSVGFALVK